MKKLLLLSSLLVFGSSVQADSNVVADKEYKTLKIFKLILSNITRFYYNEGFYGGNTSQLAEFEVEILKSLPPFYLYDLVESAAAKQAQDIRKACMNCQYRKDFEACLNKAAVKEGRVTPYWSFLGDVRISLAAYQERQQQEKYSHFADEIDFAVQD